MRIHTPFRFDFNEFSIDILCPLSRTVCGFNTTAFISLVWSLKGLVENIIRQSVHKPPRPVLFDWDKAETMRIGEGFNFTV